METSSTRALTSALREDEAYRSSKVCHQQLCGTEPAEGKRLIPWLDFSFTSPITLMASEKFCWDSVVAMQDQVRTVGEQKPLKVRPVRETLGSVEVHFRKVPGT